MAPVTIEPPPYDGPEAAAVHFQSLSLWQAVVRRAKIALGFPDPSYDLRGLLCRVPSLPDAIPGDSEWLEGYSTWTNANPACGLETTTGTTRKIALRKQHPTLCLASPSDSFRDWDGNPNNAMALLVLGWAYILTASLAERQGLTMEYGERPSYPEASMVLYLKYAAPEERAWWRAIIASGIGWSLPGGSISPWAVSVVDLDVDLLGDVDMVYPAPTASCAALYLGRFCRSFYLGRQASAALAVALVIPFHSSTNPEEPTIIDLPAPSFNNRQSSPSEKDYPSDFPFIGHYMALSLCPWAVGPALWSIFWQPDVPSHLAGAWLGAIGTTLEPIINENDLELLIRILSFKRCAPLWLGTAVCGRGTILECVLPYLTQLYDCALYRPDIDAAAWTGIPQSFIDEHRTQAAHDGTVTRADVWRLRHELHAEYKSKDFSSPPPFGWPPFGSVGVEDVEPEIRPHLDCSHEWTYDSWTWLPSGIKDSGFAPEKVYPGPPSQVHLYNEEPQEGSLHGAGLGAEVSEMATRAMFSWGEPLGVDTGITEGLKIMDLREGEVE